MAAQVVTSIPRKRRAEHESAHKRPKKSKPTQENRYKSSEEEEEEADAADRKRESFNGSSEEDVNLNSEEEDEYSFGEAESEDEEDAPGSNEEEERGDENVISRNRYAENDDDEGEEQGYAGSSEEDDNEEGCSGRDGEKHRLHFGEGSNAFRAAFTRIMEKKVPEDVLGPVLSAHKKLIAKKLDEEANDLKVKSEAKKEKRLMKEKGHVIPENFLDAKEKSLIKLATKGVVKLFNAVSKAQSVQNAFDVSKSKDAKAASKESKAAFLQELRGASRSVKPGQSSSTKTHSRPNGIRVHQQEVKEPGWAALRDDFMLTSSKLKDWDKMPGAAAGAVEEMQVGESENSSDGEN